MKMEKEEMEDWKCNECNELIKKIVLGRNLPLEKFAWKKILFTSVNLKIELNVKISLLKAYKCQLQKFLYVYPESISCTPAVSAPGSRHWTLGSQHRPTSSVIRPHFCFYFVFLFSSVSSWMLKLIIQKEITFQFFI